MFATEKAMDAIDVTTEKIRTRPKLVRKLKLLMVLCLVGGPVMLGIGGYGWLETNRLRTDGKVTDGKVLSSETLNTGKGRVSHRLVVEYHPEGCPIHEKLFLGVRSDIFDEAVKSGGVVVRYLPRKPIVSALGDDIRVEFEPIAIGAGLLLVGAMIWFHFRGKYREIDKAVQG